jgi:hypothetical protein
MEVSFRKDMTKLCPEKAMDNWGGVRPKSKWLFCDTKGQPIKAAHVQKFLKEALIKTGRDPALWVSGISLRKGGALTLALCGVPDRVIRAQGRWKSYAYRIYIDLTEYEKDRWRKAVSECLVRGAGSKEMGAINLAQVMDD